MDYRNAPKEGRIGRFFNNVSYIGHNMIGYSKIREQLRELKDKHDNFKLSDVKELFENPKLVSAIDAHHTSNVIDNEREWIAEIIKNHASDLPEEDLQEFVKFLTRSQIANWIARSSDFSDNNSHMEHFARGLCTLIDRAEPDRKLNVASDLCDTRYGGYGFGIAVMEHANLSDAIVSLAARQTPGELDNMLAGTRLMAKAPYDEGLLTDEALKNKIAVNALKHFNPEAVLEHFNPEVDEKTGLSHKPVECFCSNPTIASYHDKRAQDRIRIALSHCKDAPENTLDNEHTP